MRIVPAGGADRDGLQARRRARAARASRPTAKGTVWFTRHRRRGGARSAGSPWRRRRRRRPDADPDPDGGGGDGASARHDPGRPPPGAHVTLTPVTIGDARPSPTRRCKGDSISANQICVGPPQDRCSLVYLIQTHEYVTGFPGTKGHAAKAKKLTTIGKATVTLKGGQYKKVTVKLNAKGQKLRKKKAFKATLTVTQSQRPEAEARSSRRT